MNSVFSVVYIPFNRYHISMIDIYIFGAYYNSRATKVHLFLEIDSHESELLPGGNADLPTG